MKISDKNNDNLRLLSQILTPAGFNKIISKGDKVLIDNKIRRCLDEYKGLSYKDIIKYIYSVVEKKYRTEYIYKNQLLNKLLLKKSNSGQLIALNEFNIANSVADFILLNGSACLYEIKTEYDGFDKLDKQISDYQKFADIIHVVTSPKYSNKLLDKYSGSPIGIIELKNKTLNTLKIGIENKNHLDHEIIFKTLHKNEYLGIVKYYYGEIPKVPNTQIFKNSLSIIKKIDIDVFQKAVVNVLKQRTLKCPEILKSKVVPKELKYICFALNLSSKDYITLFQFLNNKI
ncbi:MAG: sce7726 family protein [Chlorobiaceae bacterium]|nr:sce7726 family protein [Chlorobiaceae bacterium]